MKNFLLQFLAVQSKVLKLISDSNQVISEYEKIFFSSIQHRVKSVTTHFWFKSSHAWIWKKNFQFGEAKWKRSKSVFKLNQVKFEYEKEISIFGSRVRSLKIDFGVQPSHVWIWKNIFFIYWTSSQKCYNSFHDSNQVMSEYEKIIFSSIQHRVKSVTTHFWFESSHVRIWKKKFFIFWKSGQKCYNSFLIRI